MNLADLARRLSIAGVRDGDDLSEKALRLRHAAAREQRRYSSFFVPAPRRQFEQPVVESTAVTGQFWGGTKRRRIGF